MESILKRLEFRKQLNLPGTGSYSDGLGTGRIFYGPGDIISKPSEEQSGRQFSSLLSQIMIDRFSGKDFDYFWITFWESKSVSEVSQNFLEKLIQFLIKEFNVGAISLMTRRLKGASDPSRLVYQNNKNENSEIWTREGESEFLIKLSGHRHPGLFVDHFNLRSFLSKVTKGKRVLNTFCFTGALSVACARGGAEAITSLDLSSPTLNWAKLNFQKNNMAGSQSQIICDDVFEFLPRLIKKNKKYDIVILDPPTFSRSKKGKIFSTQQNLHDLHELAAAVLNKDGLLVSSINSEEVTYLQYQKFVMQGVRNAGQWRVVQPIYLDASVPYLLQSEKGIGEGYLKGLILQKI